MRPRFPGLGEHPVLAGQFGDRVTGDPSEDGDEGGQDHPPAVLGGCGHNVGRRRPRARTRQMGNKYRSATMRCRVSKGPEPGRSHCSQTELMTNAGATARWSASECRWRFALQRHWRCLHGFTPTATALASHCTQLLGSRLRSARFGDGFGGAHRREVVGPNGDAVAVGDPVQAIALTTGRPVRVARRSPPTAIERG